jgi:hypothetical protein
VTLDRFPELQTALGPLPEHPRLSLDAGNDYSMVRQDLQARGITGQIAQRGARASIQTGRRWVVERTNSWMSNFGKLRRCTERRKAPVEFFIALASAITTLHCLIRRAWSLYRGTPGLGAPGSDDHLADARAELAGPRRSATARLTPCR